MVDPNIPDRTLNADGILVADIYVMDLEVADDDIVSAGDLDADTVKLTAGTIAEDRDVVNVFNIDLA